MPQLSARFVRCSLLYLALGFSLGAVMLVDKAYNFYPSALRLLPIHVEMLLMGFFVQLAAGVAYWILPRRSGPAPRGNQDLVWSAFWLINFGIGLVILAAITSQPAFLLVGRLVETAGVMAFVAASWKRVKVSGK